METTEKPGRLYKNHRDNQRERILEAAEALFVSSGIDKVNLSMVARAARLTRGTIYEYFPNKQEIAWAILQRIFSQAKTSLPADQQGSGIQRLEAFLLWMAGQLQENPQHMRFVVEFNTLYAREAASERMRQATGRSSGRDDVLRLLEEGITDGSIRPDLDTVLVSAVIWNLLSGMNARFGLLGDRIQQEYELPAGRIYHEILRIFLRGIQAGAGLQENEK